MSTKAYNPNKPNSYNHYSPNNPYNPNNPNNPSIITYKHIISMKTWEK